MITRTVDLSEQHLLRRWSLSKIAALQEDLKNEFLECRDRQFAKGENWHYKLIRDELFPISCFLKQNSSDHSAEFELTPAASSGSDAIVHFPSGRRLGYSR